MQAYGERAGLIPVLGPLNMTLDLVIGLEPYHLDRMRRLAPDAELHLLTDFDPAAEPGSGIDDPWYGDAAGFDDTLASIEAAMPGVLARVRELQRR